MWSDYVYIADDSPTGLRWKVNILDTRGQQTKARAGGVAGGGKPRSKVQVGSVQSLCSRVVFEIEYGPIPEEMVVDHADGDETNNKVSNLLLKTLEHNNRNMKMMRHNTSGKTGVMRCMSKRGAYCLARWQEDGKTKSRRFDVSRYGEEGAFAQACQARDLAIDRMNSNGAGYTERHGK